eukprot:Opistho-1_new@97237
MEGRRVRRRVGRTERGRHRAPRVGRFRPRKGHPLGPRQRVQQGGSRLSSPQAEPFDAVVVGFAHGCRSPAQSTLGVDCRRGVHIAAPQRRGRPPPNATGGRVPRHQWQRLDRGDECSQAREGDYRRRAGGARRSRFPPRRRRRRQQRHHLGHAPAPARAGAPGATPARGDGRQHGRGLKAALRFDHERVFACVGDDRRPQRQRQRGKPPGVRTPAIERELAAANRRRHGIIARDLRRRMPARALLSASRRPSVPRRFCGRSKRCCRRTACVSRTASATLCCARRVSSALRFRCARSRASSSTACASDAWLGTFGTTRRSAECSSPISRFEPHEVFPLRTILYASAHSSFSSSRHASYVLRCVRSPTRLAPLPVSVSKRQQPSCVVRSALRACVCNCTLVRGSSSSQLSLALSFGSVVSVCVSTCGWPA